MKLNKPKLRTTLTSDIKNKTLNKAKTDHYALDGRVLLYRIEWMKRETNKQLQNLLHHFRWLQKATKYHYSTFKL